MRNMCCVNALDVVEDATVAVLAFTAKDGTSRACAVTPYVVDTKVTVTATLALLTKAKMIRRRSQIALLVNGTHWSGVAEVSLHRRSGWFDQHIREAEKRKYPPAAQLLGFPLHRRVLWWYVGRVAMTFDDPTISRVQSGDAVTVTTVVDGSPRVHPLDDTLDTSGSEVLLGAEVSDGPACLLVHRETEGMTELLQMTLRGHVVGGVMTVASRHGSLEAQNPGLIDQLKSLRALGKLARANREYLDRWNEGTT